MWNTISNIASNYLDAKLSTERGPVDTFGQRLAIFAVAVAIHEGLSMISNSIDNLTQATNNHGGDLIRAAENLGDAIARAHREQ